MGRCTDCDTMRVELARALEAEVCLRDDVAELQTALAGWSQATADGLRRSVAGKAQGSSLPRERGGK